MHANLNTAQHTCKQCQRLFTPNRGKSLFCSRPCWLAYQTANKTQTTCEHCKKQFFAKPILLRTGRAKYCSKACYKASGRGNGVVIRSLEERFWSKVDKTPRHGPWGDCWIYTGYKDKNGYGRISSGKRDVPPKLASRVSWEIHFGPLEDELGALHRCDYPPCVRPEHLFKGTPKANMEDCSTKRRTTFGERSASAKLTNPEVIEMRARYATGNVSQKALADERGLCQTTVSELLRRVTWTHI